MHVDRMSLGGGETWSFPGHAGMSVKQGFWKSQSGRPGCESQSHIHRLGAAPQLGRAFGAVKVTQKWLKRKTGKC